MEGYTGALEIIVIAFVSLAVIGTGFVLVVHILQRIARAGRKGKV